MENISKYLNNILRKKLAHNYVPMKVMDQNVEFSNNDTHPIVKENRCVLIVDMFNYSRKTMEEQLVLVETFNIMVKNTIDKLKIKFNEYQRKDKIWDIYKSTGDGAIFVFGYGLDPSSIRDVIRFSVYLMREIISYNKRYPNAINILKVRMAFSYGDVYVTEDFEMRKDILGDAINIASRLSSGENIYPNSILLSSDVFHNLQINHALYFLNADKTLPKNGQISDFILGGIPDGNNFLYITDENYIQAKDRKIKAYNISGRIEGVDIKVEYI